MTAPLRQRRQPVTPPPTTGLVTYDHAAVAPDDRYERSRGQWWRHGRVTSVQRYSRGWVVGVALRRDGKQAAAAEIILHARHMDTGKPCPVMPRVGDGVSLWVELVRFGSLTRGKWVNEPVVKKVVIGETLAMDWTADAAVYSDASPLTRAAIARWRDQMRDPTARDLISDLTCAHAG